MASFKIQQSQELVRILELILAVGNYMNGDTFRGGAYGFTIDTLIKLCDTKTGNNQKTFLHYLAAVIKRKLPSSQNLQRELECLEKPSKVSIQQLNQDFLDISRGFRALECDCELKSTDARGTNDKFFDNVKDFLYQNQSVYKNLESEKNNMEASFKAAVTYFAEDPRLATPESFFSVFWKFLQGLERARLDNERQSEADKKADISMVVEPVFSKEELLAAKRVARQQGTNDIIRTHAQVRQGVMDELITLVKTGDIYREKGSIVAPANKKATKSDIMGSSETVFIE